MSIEQAEYPYNQKIAALGGGTGMFYLLMGLRRLNENERITAIPGTWDSGGSTGILRTEYGILPPGDPRRCLMALLDDDQREEFFSLFEDRTSGHPVGNLILAALEKSYGSTQYLEAACRLFKIKSRIIPVSTNALTLIAKYVGGDEEFEEHILDERCTRPDFNPNIPLSSVYFTARAKPNPEALSALSQADKIVISAGSLGGSILPHGQVPGVRQAILENTNAKVIYIQNLYTEKGQSDSLGKTSDYLAYITRAFGRVDYILVNDNHIDPEVLDIYAREGQYLVENDKEACLRITPNAQFIRTQITKYFEDDHLLRHDSDLLAKSILALK